MLFPREGFLNYAFKVGVEASYREVGVADGRFEILTREVAFGFTVKKVVGLSEILRADENSLRYDTRQELVPMNLSVTVYVHCVKKVPNLLRILEVRGKEFFDVLECNESIVVAINFEEHFPESFRFFLINFAAIRDNILDALTEKQTLSIILHAI